MYPPISKMSLLLVKILKFAVARGYKPLANSSPNIVAVTLPPEHYRSDLEIILPTYIERCTSAAHVETIRDLLTQISRFSETANARTAGLIVAMQHSPGDLQRARAHVDEILQTLHSEQRAQVKILLLDVHGKVAALNASIGLLRSWNHSGLVGWVDDDVELAPDALVRMAEYLVRNANLQVVGATKKPVANQQKSAKIFHNIKLIVKATGRAHPHGCALLGRMETLREGIPQRYLGEDGYIAISLFDEMAANPLWRMAIVPDAYCTHVVGGPFGQIWMRVRRTLYENSVLLADFPLERSARFADICLFHGLIRRPGAPPSRLANRLLQGLMLMGYWRVACSLIWRGLLGAPLKRISWSAYHVHTRPNTALSAGDAD